MIYFFCFIQIYKNQEENRTAKIILRLYLFVWMWKHKSRLITYINKMNKLNWRNKAISISMFDYPILYTNIPHHNLISVMGKLINFCLVVVIKNSLIEITRCGDIWTNIQEKHRLSFDKISLKITVSYWLSNS